MRRIKNPKPGEYVLLTKFSDKDVCDPFFLGFYSHKRIIGDTVNYYATDNSGKLSLYPKYRYCHRLTAQEGKDFIEKYRNCPCYVSELDNFD